MWENKFGENLATIYYSFVKQLSGISILTAHSVNFLKNVNIYLFNKDDNIYKSKN